ncbi:sigma-70 family RNA polymerase sigma factor [Kineosporia babensis]|uniref:Sigma-70 family RNA polymerase sigma factor n=1 Tax=Kineosporia babensis TaxID=499548 RepID=A0A9X1NIB4_9ACTN|nr:sigma-70 family RNA polymerase sigma factor [Kineosporia babensis]MCD5314296.1 sigma-70 family RNA polymerase sigma factor [Kineosporia babensis]
MDGAGGTGLSPAQSPEPTHSPELAHSPEPARQAQLVREAQAGDRAALEQLVEACLPLIYNIVGRSLKGSSDVDDLVQDTMVGIIHGLPELREAGRFRSWAVTIAYRRLQEHYRRRYRNLLRLPGPREPDFTDVADPGADFAERTVTELALKGQRRELAEAARWLEPNDRQIFSLWWQEVAGELSRAELAAALETSPQHAAVRLQRMRERLDGSRAVLRALSAVPRCPDLGKLVKGWDGQVDSRWRKRLARHTRDCTQCRQYSRDLVRPEALLQGVALITVPAALLAKLSGMLQTGTEATPLGPVSAVMQSLTGKAVVVGGAAVITLGGITYPLWTGSAPPPPAQSIAPLPTAPPPSIIRSPTPEAVSLSVPPTSTTKPPASRSYVGVAAADFYVAPNGSDDAAGTRSDPFASLNKAAAEIEPGQTIAMRGGTYRPSEPIEIRTSGTERQRITLSAYRDEIPVIDFGGIPSEEWGITQTGDFWTVRSLEFRNAPSHAYVCDSCNDNDFRRLVARNNAGLGLLLRGEGTSRNEVVDSDFSGGHGGLGIMYGDGLGNQVRGVRTYDNDKDGVDLGGFTSPVAVRESWSFRNGNGFTLGGGGTELKVAHVLSGNSAWDNSGIGFNEEGNSGSPELTGNTAFGNDVTGFYLPTASAVLSRNIAVANKDDAALSPTAQETENIWDAGTSVFVSVDPSGAEGERRKNGRLPVTHFLERF